MKGFLKSLPVVAALLLLSAFTALCDDGSWNRLFDVSGGSVYSETEDSGVVLEKELLIFNGKETEVNFLFRNTTGDDLTLACGFPVIQRIKAYRSGDYLEIPASRYGNNRIPGLSFFKTVPADTDIEDGPSFIYPERIPLSEYNSSRTFIGPAVPEEAGISFGISSCGKDIAVDDILVERRLTDDYAELTFHFRHSLSIAAGASVVLTVCYSQDLLYGNNGGAACDVYRWNYFIGTGSTWKSPIGEMVLIKPSGWQGELAGFRLLGGDGAVDVFYTSGWEPERSREFSLVSTPVTMMDEFSFYSDIDDFIELWKSGLDWMTLTDEPAQDYVGKINASSELSDEADVFLDNGVRAAAGFTAIRAFDGFEETSWCENVKGGGNGEFLEAVLSRPAAGIIIRNGF